MTRHEKMVIAYEVNRLCDLYVSGKCHHSTTSIIHGLKGLLSEAELVAGLRPEYIASFRDYGGLTPRAADLAVTPPSEQTQADE